MREDCLDRRALMARLADDCNTARRWAAHRPSFERFNQQFPSFYRCFVFKLAAISTHGRVITRERPKDVINYGGLNRSKIAGLCSKLSRRRPKSREPGFKITIK
jgi:hypothetical protein